MFNNRQEIIDTITDEWHIPEDEKVNFDHTRYAIFEHVYTQWLKANIVVRRDEQYHTALWSPTDTEDRYFDHMNRPETRKWIEQLGWTKPIAYRINQFGFRCDDFSAQEDKQSGIVVLGCSHTQGTGLPEEDVYVTHIENHFGIKTWNLGVPGIGPEPLVNFALIHLLDYINPTAIIFTIPPVGREHFLRNKPLDERMELVKHSGIDVVKDYLMPHNIDITGSVQSYLRSTMALKCFAQELGVPFVCSTANTLSIMPDRNLCNELAWDRARDLAHFGPRHHRLWADKYIRELEPQL